MDELLGLVNDYVFNEKNIAYRIEKRLNGDECLVFRFNDVEDEENVLAVVTEYKHGKVSGTNPVGNGFIETSVDKYLRMVEEGYKQYRPMFQ